MKEKTYKIKLLNAYSTDITCTLEALHSMLSFHKIKVHYKGYYIFLSADKHIIASQGTKFFEVDSISEAFEKIDHLLRTSKKTGRSLL